MQLSTDVETIEIDSKWLEIPCAIWRSPPDHYLAESDFRQICEKAKKKKVRFLTVVANRPALTRQPQPPGELCTYSALTVDVRERISKIKRRYRTLEVDDGNFRDIESMCHFRSDTRFSRDPALEKTIVTRHKVALYRSVLGSKPRLARIAYSSENIPIGYHLCMSDETILADSKQRTIIHYDLVIHPSYRNGFAAVDLIRDVLNTAQSSGFHAQKLSTKIYSSNTPSRDFFTKLGFSLDKDYERQYFYHFWI